MNQIKFYRYPYSTFQMKRRSPKLKPKIIPSGTKLPLQNLYSPHHHHPDSASLQAMAHRNLNGMFGWYPPVNEAEWSDPATAHTAVEFSRPGKEICLL